MTGFNPESIGFATSNHNRNVSRPAIGCAFEPAVVDKPGIEAIFEGLRLAGLECFPRYPNVNQE